MNAPGATTAVTELIAPRGDGVRRASAGEAVARVELPPLAVTPFWARRHAQAVLGAWQLDLEIVETAVLLVSELVSNAVAAVASGVQQAREAAVVCEGIIILTLRHRSDRLVIEVSDPDVRPPMLAAARPDAEAGRGLMLVQALSKEWSYFLEPGGKTVYAVLDASDCGAYRSVTGAGT